MDSSFSLNIFVPPSSGDEDLLPRAPSKHQQRREWKLKQQRAGKKGKRPAEGIKVAIAGVPGSSASSTELNAAGTIAGAPGSSASSTGSNAAGTIAGAPKSTAPTTDSYGKADSTNGEDEGKVVGERDGMVIDGNEDEKREDGRSVMPVEETAHSRKNPMKRPKPKAPLSLVRQTWNAPMEETKTETSTHLFETKVEFSGLGLHTDLVAHLGKSKEEKGMGLAVPTSVQVLAIPVLLNRKDALVRSETGSGKTLAFLLPILHSLVTRKEEDTKRISRADGTYALILSPTRELCLQIFDVLIVASKPFHWIISTAIVGGEKKKSEKARLRKGVNIVVATPGRLADHLRTTSSLRGSLEANPLRWLVMDEADRLLDAGFEKQVVEIIRLLKELSYGNAEVELKDMENRTQTVLLSATITSSVERLAGFCLFEPVRLEAERGNRISNKENGDAVSSITRSSTGKNDEEFVTPKQLVQHFILVESKDRLVGLAAFLRRHIRRTGNTCKTLVFVSSRACAEFLHQIFSTVVWPPSQYLVGGATLTAEESSLGDAASTGASSSTPSNEGFGTKWYVLHGSVDQKERKRTLKEFSQVRGGVLICTDVAARGLDLPAVDLVVQYDAPTEVSEYVHRVGRTARSGRRGAAALFLRETELEYLEILKRHGLVATPVKMSYESLLPPPPPGGPAGKKKRTDLIDPEEAKLLLQSAFETIVEKNEKMTESARNGYLSWVGAYAVHSAETKHVFVPRELHFGHVARSFALKEAPTKIKESTDKLNKVSKKRKGEETFASHEDRHRAKKEEITERKKKIKTFDSKSEFEA